MEQLNFEFNDNFINIPQEDFNNYSKNNQPIFYTTANTQKEQLEFAIPDNQIKNNNNNNDLKKQIKSTVKFSLSNLEKSTKKLIRSLPKQNKKPNKNNKKFIKVAKNTNNIKEEWNNDVKNTGFFQKTKSIHINEKENPIIKKKALLMSKEEKEREKFKSFKTINDLELNLDKNNDENCKNKINNLKSKSKEIVKIKDEIEKEKLQQKLIQKNFEENLKKIQKSKSNNLKSKPKINYRSLNKTPKQKKQIPNENLLQLENYSNPNQSLKKFLNKKQVDLMNEIHNYPEDESDLIPTKENGAQANNKKENELEKLVEEKKKQILLNEGFVIKNEQAKKIDKKIEKVKRDMLPLIQALKSKQTNLNNFPFSYNILSRTCSKLINVHSENLTELIIDDILFELIDILNKKEENDIINEKSEKKNFLIEEFIENFKELQFEQDQIIKQKEKTFEDEKKIREIYVSNNEIWKNKIKKRLLQIDDKFISNILQNKLRNSLKDDKNKRKKIVENEEITEDIIEEILEDCINEFTNVQDEFVEQLFREEFI